MIDWAGYAKASLVLDGSDPIRAFPQQPVLQLRDAAGNAVSQLGTVVTASIATGSATLGGTLLATPTPAVWQASRICRSPASSGFAP